MESFRRFEARGDDAMARELSSLAAETDPELYFAGLNHLAQRMARRDRFVEAERLWSFVSAEATGPASQMASRAREELQVLSGGGRFGRRVEFLAQRFVGEATNPAALAGMAVAGGVYSVGSNFLLARLLSSSSGVLTRGLGARVLAGVGAFALEAPAFTLTTRALHSAAGHPSNRSLGEDLSTSYLSLGGLKFFHAAGLAALGRTGGGAFSRALIPAGSAYLGILAGHGLERAFGLRPAQAADQVLLDSLAMLLQFQVAGRLTSEALGPRWRAWQSEMQVRAEAGLRLADIFPPAEGNLAPSFAPALAGGRASELPLRGPLMMVAKRPGDTGLRGLGSRPVPSAAASEIRPVEKTTLERLHDLRVEKDMLAERGENLSLWQILLRNIEQGRIPADCREELRWAIQGSNLYESSPILREGLAGIEQSPETLIRTLVQVRPAIAKEQGAEHYALATLIQALVYGGRISPDKLRSLAGLGAGYDFFQEHPVLQRMKAQDFRDPYRFVRALRPLRRQIETEAQRRYKLSTLTDALRWHPSFPVPLLQSYTMAAAASDFVGGLARRRLRIETSHLQTLSVEQVYLRLLHLKPALVGATGEPVSIGYILMGLKTHGLDRVQDGRIDNTAIHNAYSLDMVLDRWSDWGGHFGNLHRIPKYLDGDGPLSGWRRPGYARAHLLKGNGEPYSDSRLGSITSWGVFLWQHREALALPEPRPVTILPAPSRSSALREFLAPHWERLRQLEPEDLLRSLLELRLSFGNSGSKLDPGESPSLPAMVSALYRVHGGEPSDSVMNYAHQIDGILRRWGEWSSHFRRIADLPKYSRDHSRGAYAAENLKKENGENFSKSTLGSIVRWGLWLWGNRGRVGLSRGSTMPPPPGSQDNH